MHQLVRQNCSSIKEKKMFSKTRSLSLRLERRVERCESGRAEQQRKSRQLYRSFLFAASPAAAEREREKQLCLSNDCNFASSSCRSKAVTEFQSSSQIGRRREKEKEERERESVRLIEERKKEKKRVQDTRRTSSNVRTAAIRMAG